MNGENLNYPMKIVSLRKEDTRANRGNGGDRKVFVEVNQELRAGLSKQVEDVGKMFYGRFEKYPHTPAVAKVTLRNDAIAKSHRPTNLFSSSTCPIIGIGRANELFIEVNSQRLEMLKNKIMNSEAKIIEANISTLEDISPYLPADALNVYVKDQIIQEQKMHVKVQLFNFSYEKTNIDVEKEFESHLGTINAKVEKKIHYAKHLIIYKIEIKDYTSLEKITDFGGVKSLSYFPQITVNRLDNQILDDGRNEFPFFLPEPDTEYPYVGLIDSGTRDSNNYLEPWVEAREEFVLEKEKNCNHGSFVSGIIAYNERFEAKADEYDGVKIIDIVAIPNDDSSYGDVGTVNEEELIEILQEVIPKYSGKVKVWNLSLNSDSICNEQGFSDLAISLDEIQDDYDVTFVISTGNFHDDIRKWPVDENLDLKDTITSPADSIRGITVGSISHIDSDLSSQYCPSPFTRRGPGPNYITKPDLVEFGGNLAISPPYINGIISFDESGNLTTGVGTSYSTPRVSALLSKIHHYLDHEPSRNLAKALLIHSAVDKRINKRPESEDKNYLGFGQPQNLQTILEGNEFSSTIVFEGSINPSTYIEINDFPFPEVMKDNEKWFGEIFVTLVYSPPLDSNYSFEYCRTNIDVSLGTDKPNGYSGEVPMEKFGDFERELVESGMKWAPVKVYHRKISKGINSHPWKLKLTLSGRSEEDVSTQDFVLIVTIADPAEEKEVYQDIAQQLQQRFLYNDLQLSNRIRPTVR